MFRRGFTLIELLVVIGIIGILASITIVAINPAKQIASTRNAQRRSDVNTITNAIYQYVLKNGQLPPGITATNRQICKTSSVAPATQCNNGVDLDVLTGAYIAVIPVDPQAPASGTGTRYWIYQGSNTRITVTASGAELGETISMSR